MLPTRMLARHAGVRLAPRRAYSSLLTTAPLLWVDRAVSARTSRLFRLMIKALRQLTSNVQMRPDEMLLAGFILNRVLSAPNDVPVRELEQLGINAALKPPRLDTDELGQLRLPAYAAPLNDARQLRFVSRCLQHASCAYAASDDEVLPLLQLRRHDMLLSIWQADADMLLPAFYVAVDHQIEALVVSVRGTYSVNDTLVNFTAAPDVLGGGTVHRGMSLIAQQLLHALTTRVDIQRLLQEYPGYMLLFTGHSMGAAVAAMAAIRMKVSLPTTRAYIFCPPSCMSRSLADSCAPFVLSFINGDDVVPRFHFDAIQRLRRFLTQFQVQAEVLRTLHLDTIITPQLVSRIFSMLRAVSAVYERSRAALVQLGHAAIMPLLLWAEVASKVTSVVTLSSWWQALRSTNLRATARDWLKQKEVGRTSWIDAIAARAPGGTSLLERAEAAVVLPTLRNTKLGAAAARAAAADAAVAVSEQARAAFSKVVDTMGPALRQQAAQLASAAKLGPRTATPAGASAGSSKVDDGAPS
ncbi:MAG: lipase family protein, partial [Methanobacteriota archaeon]